MQQKNLETCFSCFRFQLSCLMYSEYVDDADSSATSLDNVIFFYIIKTRQQTTINMMKYSILYLKKKQHTQQQ